MFWLFAVFSAYIAQFHREKVLIRFFIKPLPVGLLLVDAITTDNTLLVWGLVFSAAGDVLLIPSNGVSAAFGVVSFFTGKISSCWAVSLNSTFTAHVMYIQNFGFNVLDIRLLPRVLLMFAFVIYLLLTILDKQRNFVTDLWFSISESRDAKQLLLIKLIVTFYASMLFCMMLSGIDATMTTSHHQPLQALAGALLFVCSDLLIATKAVVTIPFHDAVIMMTYYCAQFCITNWSTQE